MNENMNNSFKKELCHHFYIDKISEADGLNMGLPIEKIKYRVHSVWYEFPTSHESDIEFFFEVPKTLLKQISDTSCVCSRCSRQFSIKNMEIMTQLFNKMDELQALHVDKDAHRFDTETLDLIQALEPTWFIKDADEKSN